MSTCQVQSQLAKFRVTTQSNRQIQRISSLNAKSTLEVQSQHIAIKKRVGTVNERDSHCLVVSQVTIGTVGQLWLCTGSRDSHVLRDTRAQLVALSYDTTTWTL